MNSLKKLWSIDKIDVVVAIAGAALGIFISFLNIIYSNEYMITIGPMLIIVCLAYLVFRKKLHDNVEEAEAGGRVIKIINIVFWLSFAVSTYSLSTEVLHRPLIYFILISVCASAIALQILFARGKGTTWLILLEIFLVSLSVRASAYFVFPTLPGSDPWEHLRYIQDFVNTKSIASTHGDVYYLNYPVTHLNAAVMYLITGAGYKTTMFFGIGLPLILSTIFVFLIGKEVVNARVGLLAALLVNLADTHVQFGVQLGATTYGVALFTLIVYMLIRNKYLMSMTAIAVMLLLLLIITHNMSSFVMFCYMAFFCVGVLIYKLLYREKETRQANLLTLSLFLMFGVAMLGYWIYASYIEGSTFFEAVTNGLYNAFTGQAGFLARSSVLSPESGYLSPILNITGFLLLYLFGTMGCLLWLSRQHQSRAKVALFVTTTLLTVFALSFPVFGIRNIVPARWYAFIFVILSLPAATALLNIACRTMYRQIGSCLLICAMFIVSFFMITNNISNVDSPAYAAELNERLVYTESEMAAATWVVEVYDGSIVTDLQYGSRVIETNLGGENVNFNMLDDGVVNSSLVIWRDVMVERPINVAHEVIVLQKFYEQKLSDSHNLIYSSNTSKAFLPKVR